MKCENISVSETLGIQRERLDVKCGCGENVPLNRVRETEMTRLLCSAEGGKGKGEVAKIEVERG